jgi:hypothetical protein
MANSFALGRYGTVDDIAASVGEALTADGDRGAGDVSSFVTRDVGEDLEGSVQ